MIAIVMTNKQFANFAGFMHKLHANLENTATRWWFQIFFMFIPILGKMNPF